MLRFQNFLAWNDSDKLIHTFISNRLDCCNTLFTSLAKYSIDKLQLIKSQLEEPTERKKKKQNVLPVAVRLTSSLSLHQAISDSWKCTFKNPK